MNFSMTGQEKGDLSIQVTDWTGLTVHVCILEDVKFTNFVVYKHL
jgi:hypothetical protein